MGFCSLKLTLLFLLLHVSQSCEHRQKDGKPNGKQGITCQVLGIFTSYLCVWLDCISIPYFEIKSLFKRWNVRGNDMHPFSVDPLKANEGVITSLSLLQWSGTVADIKLFYPRSLNNSDEDTSHQPTLYVAQEQEIDFQCVKPLAFRVCLFSQYKPVYPDQHLSFN